MDFIFYWDATDWLGINVDLLNDLFLDGVPCDLPLCILFIPDQLTTVEQPIEMISQVIGNWQPLVKGQLVPFTQMFLQTPCWPREIGRTPHCECSTHLSCSPPWTRTPQHERNHFSSHHLQSPLWQAQTRQIVQGNSALVCIGLGTCILGLKKVAYEQHPCTLSDQNDLLNEHADQNALLPSLHLVLDCHEEAWQDDLLLSAPASQ